MSKDISEKNKKAHLAMRFFEYCGYNSLRKTELAEHDLLLLE